MRILVSGGDGFVGAAVVADLRAHGHEVTAMVYRREASDGADEVWVDLGRPAGLDALAGRRFDAIVHTAGIVDQRAPAALHHRINAGGTAAMVELAGELGVGHFVQISSIAVYGIRAMGEGRSEATRRLRWFAPTPYMGSKARAERHVEAGRVPYTILRLPSIVGAGDPFVSAALVPAIERGAIDVIGRRDRRFSTVYVRNLGPILDALLARGPLGEALHCSDEATTWGTFVDAHAAALGVTPRRRRRSRAAILRSLADKDALFLLTGSAFGAHFPADRLRSRLDLPALAPWQEGVREGVEAFLARSGRRSPA